MAPKAKKPVPPAAHFRALAKDGPRPVYAVDGVDVLVGDFVRRIREAVFPPGAMGVDFNLSRLVGREVTLGRVLEDARTLPAFAPRRLIIVQQAEPLLERAAEEDERAFVAYLQDPSPSTTLVLVATTKFDGKRKLYKALQAAGATVRFDPPGEREMPGAVKERAEALGQTIAPDAVETLVERVGADLGEMHQALERIVLFRGPDAEGPIRQEDVEAVVAGVREEDAFAVVAAIAAGDRAEVARGLHRVLVVSGEPPVKFLGALAWHFRSLFKVREALERGVAPNQMYTVVRAPRGALERFLRVARETDLGRIGRALASIASTDRALKGGRLDHHRALERLTLALREDRIL